MKIAFFPGSFDPFTNAHLDIVRRGLLLFDKIIVAIGDNSSKQGMLSSEQKKEGISSLFDDNDRVEVIVYSGLTVSYCKEVNAKYILRGLRNVNDFVFENAIAQNNILMDPTIETFFLLSRSKYSYISSTIVREIFKNKGDISALVPARVLASIE